MDRTSAGQVIELDEDAVLAEWARRASREGLARVMRASQPPELMDQVTEATRRHLTRYLDEIARRLRGPIDSAVEVGCGVGRMTPLIASRARRVEAVDMTDEMLRAASRACAANRNVDFIKTRAQLFPWGSTRFDLAVSIWVLMHVLDDESLGAICRGVARSCRYLVLIEYEHAAIPVSRYSMLRSLDEYLALLPGGRVLQRGDLDYGGDRSFVALIGLNGGA